MAKFRIQAHGRLQEWVAGLWVASVGLFPERRGSETSYEAAVAS